MGRGSAETKEEALRKLFVGGVSRDTTDDQFNAYFASFGEITDSIVIKDNAGNSKGFGFVTFSNDEDAESCIKAKDDGHIIQGKSVEVKRAIPRDAEPEQRERNSKMFVGGLNRNTTEDTIKQYFETGYNCTVESVDLIYEKKDQVEPGQEPKPRGFAFVTINDFDVVDHVCVLRHHTIDGKEVEVKKAAPKTSNAGRGRSQGGGYGNQGGYGGGYNNSQGGGGYGGYNQGGYSNNGGGYGGGGYNQGGYNQGGGYQGGGYQGGYSQGGYGGGYGGGYNQGGGGYQQGGYNQGGGYQSSGYQGGYNQGDSGYGGSYQNNNFSGPDKNARGGKQGNRGTYRPY